MIECLPAGGICPDPLPSTNNAPHLPRARAHRFGKPRARNPTSARQCGTDSGEATFIPSRSLGIPGAHMPKV